MRVYDREWTQIPTMLLGPRSLDALNLEGNHRLLDGMLSLSDLVNKHLKGEVKKGAALGAEQPLESNKS